MAYFLGIDQGGSKTQAIIGDDTGHILGLAKSRGAVHSSDGMNVAMMACGEACSKAVEEAGITFQDIYGVYGGLTGIDWPDEGELVGRALAETLGISNVHVVNDCLIALRGGTDAENSAIICAGSGLNCAVKAGNRQIQYGFYIPDRIQGGMALGNATLQSVFDAEAGIAEKTSLTEACLSYFHKKTVDELLRSKVEGNIENLQILFLPRILEQQALLGDKVANSIFTDFALSLSPFIVSGMKKLNIVGEPIEIVLSGSIFKCKADALIKTLKRDLLEKIPTATVIDAEYEPIIGAYLMALDVYCGNSTTGMFRAVKENCKYNIFR
jgi:N-acetylglucosamine kinase-like BadF-type ATPase